MSIMVKKIESLDSDYNITDERTRALIFTSLIQQIERSLFRLKIEHMQRLGLKGIHALCIFQLAQSEDGFTQRDLIEATGEDKASISRAITQLKSKGYVKEIASSDGKKYNTRFALAKEGKPIGKIVEAQVLQALNIASEGIGLEERATLYKCLSGINTKLSSIVTEGLEI